MQQVKEGDYDGLVKVMEFLKVSQCSHVTRAITKFTQVTYILTALQLVYTLKKSRQHFNRISCLQEKYVNACGFRRSFSPASCYKTALGLWSIHGSRSTRGLRFIHAQTNKHLACATITQSLTVE
jgi:hypothetical protein